MALLANTDRHKSLLKTAFKRLKAHPERSSLFYVVVHRSNKNALLHIDPKPVKAKSFNNVKNPKAIQNHLKKMLKDSDEEALKTLLELSKDSVISDAHLKKLCSCAGEVEVKVNAQNQYQGINFKVVNRGGKASAADLKKALNIGVLKKIFPGGFITVDGGGIDSEAAKAEVVVDHVDFSAFEKGLAGIDGDSMTPENQEKVEDLMAELGISPGDLDSYSGHDSTLKSYIDSINGDFGFDEDAESLQQREASVLEFIAGLAMDAWNVNISNGPGPIEEQMEVLKATLEETPGEDGRYNVVIDGVEKWVTKREAEDYLAALDEGLLLLEFNTPVPILERLESLRGSFFSLGAARMTDVLSRDPTLSSVEEAMERGRLREQDILMPMGENYTPEEKLLMVKMKTDENVQIIDTVMGKITNAFQDTTSGRSRKDPINIDIKANRPDVKTKDKQWLGIEHIRDTFRFKTVVSKLTDIPEILKVLLEERIRLVKIDTSKFLLPKTGSDGVGFGWRIIAFDLLMPNK